MMILRLVKDYEDGKRTMDGYAFDGKAVFDTQAIARAYSHLTGYELENKIDELVDSLYDGDEPIYETDIGLCSVSVHWETKEPLAWCKVVKSQEGTSMEAREFVTHVMENDREGIEAMTPELAADILGWMREDDENGRIPADLTAEQFAEIWNEMKGVQAE